jgi:hypothetical protein
MIAAKFAMEAMDAMALIEIDGLPFLQMVIFYGKLLVITRWNIKLHVPTTNQNIINHH